MARLSLRLVLFVAMAGSLAAPASLYGQADPFDFAPIPGNNAPGGFPSLDDVANPVTDAPAIPPSRDPLVNQLRRLAGGTPQQMGVAIREAIRTRLWSEVSLYLGSERFASLDADGLKEVAREIGGLMLTRAGSAGDELSDGARAALKKLAEARSTAASDAQQLDAALKQLGSENPSVQLSAARQLLRGGPLAMVKLIEASAAAQPPVPRSRLLSVLRGFERPAIEATAQLAQYGTDALRPGALITLYGLDPQTARIAMLGLARSAAATEAERQIAEAGLQRLKGMVPSSSVIETQLAERLRSAERIVNLAGLSDPPATVWRVTDDRASVETVTTTAPAAAAVAAADAAEWLRRQGRLRPETFALAYGAALRHAYLTDPEFGTGEDVQRLSHAWGSLASDPRELGGILKRGLGSPFAVSTTPPDPALAIAAIRMLAAAADASAVIGESAPTPLITAVDHSLPQVRYEAALAVAALQPERAYAGSHRVLNRWIEMSALEGQPTALVLINDTLLGQQISQRLGGMGYVVRRVRRVRELLNSLEQGGDIQVIVSTTRPPDFSVVEMVDRIRRHRFGGSVPILLAGPSSRGTQVVGQRWAAPVEVVPIPADTLLPGDAGDPRTLSAKAATTLALQLSELVQAGQLPPLSAAQRRIFSMEASRNLAALAEQESLEDVYHWRDQEEELFGAVRRVGYGPEGMRVLSGIGSPASQSLLASLAANPGFDDATRRAAAEAFAVSIARHGTRLSRSDIAAQYDRFNQATDRLTREVVGTVLDAIEARVGVSSKPTESPDETAEDQAAAVDASQDDSAQAESSQAETEQ